jgi:hypothetical protein
MKFAYADPPYLGMGAKHYGYPEWDNINRHKQLLLDLNFDYPDGWALSCNPSDLGWLMPEMNKMWDDVRVGAWVKTFASFKPNVNPAYAWEPVLWRGGRKVGRAAPTVRDWVAAPITLKKGLTGAKPEAFCSWVLALLGYDDIQDTIDDLFPGTGVMGRVAAQGVLGWSR